MQLRRIVWTLAALTMAPAAALAHPGHSEMATFGMGFQHPFGGLDHILAMAAVGLYAVQLGGRALWMLPLAFVLAMLGGGLAGFEGLGLPMVEPVIALSVIAMGVLIAAGVRLPVLAGSALVATFAVFHGFAHGSEAGSVAGFAAYSAGFALATAALHGAGIGLGLMLDRLSADRGQTIARLSGAAGALAGVTLLIG